MSRSDLELGYRARTVSDRELKADYARRVRLNILTDPVEGRPRTRGDCANVPRPCPFVGCRENLYLDITDAGGIKLSVPDLEPGDVEPELSCALDIADLGGATLDDVARPMNVTRERLRQLEVVALRSLSRRGGALREHVDGVGPVARRVAERTAFGNRGGQDLGPDDIDDDDELAPITAISFFADAHTDDVPLTDVAAWERIERTDEAVCARVWNIFAKASNANGFDARSAQQLSATKRRADTKEEEQVKATSDRETAVIEAYRALAVGGEEPSRLAVAKKAGIVGKNDVVTATMAGQVMKRLRARGLLTAGKPAKHDHAASKRATPPQCTSRAKAGACGLERPCRRGVDRTARPAPPQGRGDRHGHRSHVGGALK